ncbi:TolC family protein [Bacteroides caecigallinarum]|uniref:TolC family protein n=1 Tax=Bacteroides caecigallinarum TaxID=1411144 RepID=UPI001F2CB05F|nr:TolC family protein [Bacteroides caecigallinarum]MCF2593580.1 TolC family protein [Bacteroides caecigallinarum]
MKKIFTPIILILAATQCMASGSDSISAADTSRTMTLHDCMEYAIEYSTKNEIQRLDNADARTERRDAILKTFTPSVSAGTYAYSNFGRAVDPETNTYINTTSFNNGYSLSASITLFNGFSAINNIRISQTAVKMGISQEERLRDELCLAVMEAYFNVLYHTEMTEVLRRQVENSKASLLLMQKQYEAGQKSRPDVAQMEADLADREYQLETSFNSSQDALLTLKSVMMWPVEEELEIDRTMIDEKYSALVEEDRADEIMDYAVSSQPSALIAKGTMDKAKFALNTARWQFLPSLSLSGGWSTSYYSYPGNDSYAVPSFNSQWKNNSGEYIQLSLSFPIYDRLSRFSNLSKKKNEYRRAEAQYRQTVHDIKSEVRRAIQDKTSARKSLVLAMKRSKAQEATYLLHDKKMRQGMVSPIDYQTITNSFLNSQAEELNALLQYYLKRSVVKYYKGISYINQ